MGREDSEPAADGRPRVCAVAGSGDFRERGLDVIGGGECRARERGREQRVVGEEVDLAWEPAGRVVNRLLGGGVEERDLGAGEAEAMGEIPGEFSRVSAAMW